MQLAFFDSWIDPAFSDGRDLENLAFFGTTGALLSASSAGLSGRETAARWERLLSIEAERVRRAGLVPSVALGLPAEAVPRRDWKSLFFLLESLQSPLVRCIGPLSLGELPRHEEAFAAQLDLAKRLGLPCVVALPERGKLPYMARVVACTTALNIPPARLAFLHCDGKALVRAKAVGAFGIVTVHPDYQKTKPAVSLLTRQGSEGTLLASGLGLGPNDVLALPKVALGLGKAGVSSDQILRLTYQNAALFLGLASAPILSGRPIS